MVKCDVDAHIQFKHSLDEVEALDRATIPMRQYILAVSSPRERHQMALVLGGQYFRSRDARAVAGMLSRAAKYAKAHLGDFFPIMRAQILDDALALEEAVMDYQVAFDALKNETIPTN